jgi:hypothetical protein
VVLFITRATSDNGYYVQIIEDLDSGGLSEKIIHTQINIDHIKKQHSATFTVYLAESAKK